MDSHTKKRLVWSLFSNVVSRLAQTAMYVLPASLRIAHDTFPAFMVGMLHLSPLAEAGRAVGADSPLQAGAGGGVARAARIPAREEE
jgi:hypothetical protein